MEDIIDIAGKLSETDAAIARWERVLRNNPREESAQEMIATLDKRRNELEGAFAEAAEREFLDVCSYRMALEENEPPKVSALARALSDFQSLLTVVYDALKNGPKDQAKVSADSTNESALEFGYSFAGSVGFVMTMPNERLLFGESNLDLAMKLIFEMAKAKETGQIAAYAKQVGVAPVRKIYQWADDHVSYGMDADIKWLRNQHIRSELRVNVPELQKLKETIDRTSEDKTESVEVEGLLVGADVKTCKFHITFQEAA